ncbi:MAG: glycosyltransferase family 4 protein [Methanomassiliicoccales archaeon]|nr:glycosyltransferase family 4 protein [Methanomassiliicoccales archaeon]
MRIVQVNPFHYPFLGGIEHRIHHLSTRLSRRNEVIVLTGRLPGTSSEEKIDGYEVKRLDSSILRIYNPPHIRTPGVRKALEDLEPDVVDFHYRWARSYTNAILGFKGPKVFTWHNSFGEGEGIVKTFSKWNDMLFARHIGEFKRIACVSKFVMDDLASRGFPREKLAAVPNGVELPPSSQREEDFILFVGRLVRTKGLDYLLEAMTKLDTRLVICGAGPEMERLKKRTKGLGVSERVDFKGRVTEEVKQDMLSSCKVFVFPSIWESYGIAAAEAMSHGKPVVATSIGGLPEVVGDAGFLVAPRDPSAIAAATTRLLEDDDMRARMGKAARARAMTFTWEKAAEDMEKVYEQAMKAE